MNLYCTADKVGTRSGGGVVTKHEIEALRRRGPVTVLSGDDPALSGSDPFAIDATAKQRMQLDLGTARPSLAHFYAGTFTDTVRFLRERGVKISYTAAAHDRKKSIQEFDRLGIPYPFEHMRDGPLWERYVGGYREADLVICPSSMSAAIMRSYGCRDVRVIPHGIEIPASSDPMPERFRVGYLGQSGPDKGLIYLFRAWAKLRYPDATLFVAGRGTETLVDLWRREGGGRVNLMGFVESPSTLYRACSVYVQPSVSEGFGIEILEAMAHGRVVIASDGAGASEVIQDGETGFVVPQRNHEAIAEKIDWAKRNRDRLVQMGALAMATVKEFSWDAIRDKYVELWRTL